VDRDVGYRRKKQPEAVRFALLECASRLASNHGVGALNLNAVADAAGVTKGGLYHHFPSKNALVEALFDNAIVWLDRHIDHSLSTGPQGFGMFTRAYVDIFLADAVADESPWAALISSVFSDASAIEVWDSWLRQRLEFHSQTDSDPALEIVRLAADGAWTAITAGFQSAARDPEDVHRRLISMIAEVAERLDSKGAS